jgi:hypothetical protein
MKITIGNTGRRNFHRASNLTLVVSDHNIDGNTAQLTRLQARKVERHFCGFTGCTCGSAPAGYEPQYDGRTGEMTGATVDF